MQRQRLAAGNAPAAAEGQGFLRAGRPALCAVDRKANFTAVHLFCCHIGGKRHQRPAVLCAQGDGADADRAGGAVDDADVGCGIDCAGF